MISQNQLELLAKKAGYAEPRDYACDHDLSRCETCRKWGTFGEEVYSDGVDYYCDDHRPEGEVVR